MRFPSRLFKHSITRRRQLPGMRNEYGEFIEGAIEETVLQGSLQPLSAEDKEVEGGAMVSDKLVVYALNVEPGRATLADEITWNGMAIRWGDDTLLWEGPATMVVPGPVLASGFFAELEADRVLIGSEEYEVVEVKNWPGQYCRAVILREE